jgi:peptidase M28-like protein
MIISTSSRLSACLIGIAIFLGAVSDAQTIRLHYHPVSPEVIDQRLRLVKSKDPEREQTLMEMFQEAGCRGERLTELPVKHERVPNLVCTEAGTSDAVIVVGGHMDYVSAGRGVVDDWSGASLLPSLFESLNKAPRKHTFVYIGFTNEEEGLIGSKFYVKQLTPEEAGKIRAMVNLECLGLTPTKVWAHHADPKLLQGLANVAAAIHSPIQSVNVENVGDDDADSFRARKFPTITIHSVTQETLSVLHSPRDNFSAMNADYYYESYRLIAAYLAYLDETLD